MYIYWRPAPSIGEFIYLYVPIISWESFLILIVVPSLNGQGELKRPSQFSNPKKKGHYKT